MMLHSAEKEIDEKAVGAVLKAAGVKADDARVKALVASLASVDIGEAMSQAIAAPAAAAPAAAAGGSSDAPAAKLLKFNCWLTVSVVPNVMSVFLMVMLSKANPS